MPFGNGYSTVFQAFERIEPGGATPLALGLRRSLDYIKESSAKKPLLVLITDGIPSLSCGEMSNPLADALTAASDIKELNYSFLCIGLEATDVFLQRLTRAAGGVLYSFSTYEKQAFAQS